MTYIIGHRGAMGYEPENTLRSFREAAATGADAIELDVHLCRSGELVVIHDETVDRTTDGKGYVSELTLAEIKELDAGKGEKVPTLDEVLSAISLPINIELKGMRTAEPVYNLIKNYDRFLISSFDWNELRDYRRLDPKIRIGVLAPGLPDDYFDFAESVNAYSVNPGYSHLSKDLVKAAHEKHMFVYTWTINTDDEIKRAIETNVDGIVTNFPNNAKKYLNGQGSL